MTDDATLRSDFDQFDKDKNGFIDEEEFGALVDFLEINLSSSEKATAFLAIDINGNRRIEFSEFKAWWLKYQD